MSDRGRLEQLLERGGRFIEPLRPGRLLVYGAGNCGTKVAAIAQQAGFEVAAFVDARSTLLTTVDGIACFAPESQEVKALAREGIPIVIGIFNHATDTRPIHDGLRLTGFSRIVSYPEFHDLFGEAENFWLTKRSYYKKWKKEILAGFDLFADDISRQVYHDTIAYRSDLNGSLLQNPGLQDQYLPRDLPPPLSPMRFIDGGAFTGDTLQSFLEHGLRFEAVAAFEPDAANYRTLEATVARLNGLSDKISLFRCGLGEKKETHSFSSGSGAGSSIARGGTTEIEVVALDKFIPDFAPNFIKLDIEGAELEALRGAAQLVQKFRPRLAVSAYHQADHLWAIPKLIQELQSGYRLALRYHQWNGFDLVVYAF